MRVDVRSAGLGVQWLLFIAANVIVPPIVVGDAFHLGPAGTILLEQRTLVLAGAVSLLQYAVGHRMPIVEGPSGLWWSLLLAVAAMAGGSPSHLALMFDGVRGGLIVAGLVLVALTAARQIGRVAAWFTPGVVGVYLLLLSIQLTSVFLPGVLRGGAHHLSGAGALVDVGLVAFVLWLVVRGPANLRPFGVLAGIGVGWAAYAALGWTPRLGTAHGSFPLVPTRGIELVPSLVLLCVITALVNVANTVASVQAMRTALAEVGQSGGASAQAYDWAALVTGVGDVCAGLLAAIGMISLSTSASIVRVTRTPGRAAFVGAAAAVLVAGVLPPVVRLIAGLPPSVGDSVLLVAYVQMAGIGLSSLERAHITAQNVYRVGLPLVAGAALMTLPPATWASSPVAVRVLAGNGLIVGVVLALVLDRLRGWWEASEPEVLLVAEAEESRSV